MISRLQWWWNKRRGERFVRFWISREGDIGEAKLFFERELIEAKLYGDKRAEARAFGALMTIVLEFEQ